MHKQFFLFHRAHTGGEETLTASWSSRWRRPPARSSACSVTDQGTCGHGRHELTHVYALCFLCTHLLCVSGVSRREQSYIINLYHYVIQTVSLSLRQIDRQVDRQTDTSKGRSLSHTRIYTSTLTRKLTHAQIHTHAHIHMHTHTHTYSQTRKHPHTSTHTSTHTTTHATTRTHTHNTKQYRTDMLVREARYIDTEHKYL